MITIDIYTDRIEYRKNGLRHKRNGPAIQQADGSFRWYEYGKTHRIDGPAVKWPDGHEEWWINGTSYTKAKFNKIAKRYYEDTMTKSYL